MVHPSTAHGRPQPQMMSQQALIHHILTHTPPSHTPTHPLPIPSVQPGGPHGCASQVPAVTTTKAGRDRARLHSATTQVGSFQLGTQLRSISETRGFPSSKPGARKSAALLHPPPQTPRRLISSICVSLRWQRMAPRALARWCTGVAWLGLCPQGSLGLLVTSQVRTQCRLL